jgi:hypothetical protein
VTTGTHRALPIPEIRSIEHRSGASLPVFCGRGTPGDDRMHGVPRRPECYRQLSRRAGDRPRPVSVGSAFHSKPHPGDTVLYFTEPL